METAKKTPEVFLSWEITRAEKYNRARKLLLSIGLPLLLVSVIGALLYRPLSFASAVFTGELDDFLYEAIIMVGGAIGAILIFFVTNRFLPYANRKYHMDSSGVIVEKGKQKEQFMWNELDNFFVHRSAYFPESTKDWPGEYTRKEIQIASEDIEGKVFYLLKKPRNRFWGILCKTYVVLYSEPDNSQKVNSFLSQYLPQKEMKPMVDLGLRFYYFR